MGYEWTGDHWPAAAGAALSMTTDEATERAQLLGVAAARCAAGAGDEQARFRGQDPPRRPWLVTRSLAGAGGRPRHRPVVVDLSALWAGPLAGRLLAEWGAEVVKVEDPARPDGLAEGAPAFYERLNAGKARVSLSLDAVISMMEDADVVITSARPRVWEQLAIPPLRGTWVRITGYGSTGPWRNRVAFGDDAAVAGGLVEWDTPARLGDGAAGGLVERDTPARLGDGAAGGPIEPGHPPSFVGDAIADPLTGILAAAAALSGLEHGGGQVIDLAMREAAGWLGRPRPVGRYPPGGHGPHRLRLHW
jgi:crotonobetainyl-CoA:carnitine CoA-transferase CaiB-like acyl-CoA transferase